MSDIIQLLPDSVANQIAAGEVIQRPASVVKELVENAIDAESTEIKIHIKDAGKSLIQISDNGKGMSETDARLAFERHATSKIRAANDLFTIRTMGFRGEALASIAAIAHVDLLTRQATEELGTHIQINGSVVETQEAASCPNGSNFSIKNLFYNVPARRKFLKSDNTELKHIITEFQRIALANPSVGLSLYHNNDQLYKLPSENRRQRILHLFGKNLNPSLTPIHVETSIVTIKGYIGKPEYAKKKAGEQFFYVNERYMRHPYFHKAVSLAYDKLLANDQYPLYFLFIEVDPASIDINIHPTKTEIKFEEANAIFQIIRASIKEALGKFNITPSLDFEQTDQLNIPVLDKNKTAQLPSIELDPTYNPFAEDKKHNSNQYPQHHKTDTEGWEQLYNNFDQAPQTETQQSSLNFDDNTQSQSKFVQIKNRYILTPVKSGLMIIDQQRAHERILFEHFMHLLNEQQSSTQQSLFPSSMDLDAGDFSIFREMLPDLQHIGFDINELSKNSISILGVPAELTGENPVSLIESLIENYKNTQQSATNEINEKVAQALAKSAAISYSKNLSVLEMQQLIDKLFACYTPNFSPDGKTIVSIMNKEEIEKRFL